ncbi:pyruvate kinase [Immundisolibacter sp.]|uniref:pyruvate kinase n=1 Tax=Immundisolibacter sp. TaxID=1934948 RepID=UPI00261A964A|nr:pyruvate kinase [Immundisolibacter sp.]MDD3650820.1 pyruvate kinase [Immundisolibacter sp.]
MTDQRQTRIVATLGPATDPPGVLHELLRAGMNVARINFSHGQREDHERRIAALRAAANDVGCDVAVLADLAGPKVRVRGFRDGPVTLKTGQRFCIDASLGEHDGTAEAVGTDYAELAQDVQPGDRLLLNDGLIQLRVIEVRGDAVHCEVEAGGELSDHKGINKQGGGLSAGALTAKDREDIPTAAALEVDYLAVSFVRRALDIELTRELLRGAGGHGRIVAKIERSEAVAALDSIVEAADAVMVARGDLGVEIGDAELPGVQKRIIAAAREMNRPCITATQMMESMIEHPVPTRAEVLDVANAVMDGTDAVMLSAETSVGAYPVRVVETVARICLGAERYPVTERSAAQVDRHFERTDEAIAMAAMYLARHGRIGAAVALTDSGHTALLLSRLLHGIPIYAMTEHARTRRRLALMRGVTAVNFDRGARPYERVAHDALALLRERGLLAKGMRVLVTKGDQPGSGRTNTLLLMDVS